MLFCRNIISDSILSVKNHAKDYKGTCFARVSLKEMVIKMKFTKNSSGYDYKTRITGESDKLAEELKQKVLSSKNTEEIYDIPGKKYYISKEMTVKDIPTELSPGDAILFERGGVYRLLYREWIVLPDGVIMGSYGEGEKPKFYGSQRNFADNSLWEKVEGRENVYRTFLHGGNAGNMVFDEVACLGVKKWALDDVKENYDFFYDSDEYLYFCYSGNIGEDFDSIEISQRGNLITFGSNCIVDNICVKYTGSHGIDGKHATENTVITNCEIGFIGGSMQFGTTRFGNGIEFSLGAINATVRNNYIYECYDAGLTFQSWSSCGKNTYYHNIDFSENLIEKCAYGIEYFTTNTEGSGLYSDYKNITFSKNIIRFSGYEWSQLQRPDPWMTSHIRGGQWAYMDDCENFTITDNIFDICKASIVFWWWHDEERNVIHPEPHKGLTVKNNTYYQGETPDKRCMTFHKNVPVYAENEEEFLAAVHLFEEEPAKAVWLGDMKNNIRL